MTATVDEILGPAPMPSVDEVLGAPPAPKQASTIVDDFLAGAGIGHVLDAFRQGARDGWGSVPLGLSPESEKALREAGVFQDVRTGRAGPLRAFNEAFMRPAAAALDAALRAPNAVYHGLGDVAIAAGVPRDIVALPEAYMGDAAALFSSRSGAGVKPALDPIASSGEAGSVPAPLLATIVAPGDARASPPAAMADSGIAKDGDAADRLFAAPAAPVVDKAGNINLDRIEAADDVKDVIRQAADEAGGFQAARRGTMSLTETENLADELGMTANSLDTRKIGAAFNAEQITAARKLLVQSAADVRDLAGQAVASGGDAGLLAYARAKARHMTIQEQVAGFTAEGGRALNAFKIMAGEVGEAKSLGDFLKERTGDSLDDLRTEAQAIGALDTPGAVSRFINDSRTPGFKEKFLYYWTNGLLSGPFTHSAYAMSNAVFDLWSVPETAVAAAIGKARQQLPGADAERVMFGEAGVRLWGFLRGAPEGFIAGYRALKVGVPEMLPGETAPPNSVMQMKPIDGTFGTIIGLPSRAIGGIHSFFRALSYRQELEALAWRQAGSEGLRPLGGAFWTRRAALLDAPPAAMMDKAIATANYQTFVQKLGETGGLAQQLANKTLLGKMVFPFIRTPLDLFKAANERLPTALADGEVRANLRGARGAVARDTQMARLVLASALGAATLDLASQGLITGGGPSEPNKRNTWLLTHQPYSLRLGDTWHDYHRFAPLGTIIGIYADMHEVAGLVDQAAYSEAAGLAVKAASKAVLDETFMRGAAALLEAARDPDRYAGRYLRNQAATLLPFSIGMAQTASILDPDMRQARTLVDVLKSKVAGERQTLYPTRDIWGENIPNAREGFGAIIASRRANDDPVSQTLLKLGIFPAPVQREIRGVKLDDRQHDDYARIAGRLAKASLNPIVRADYWDSLPAFAQRDLVARTIEQSRETARTLLMMQNPAIVKAAVEAKVQKLAGPAAVAAPIAAAPLPASPPVLVDVPRGPAAAPGAARMPEIDGGAEAPSPPLPVSASGGTGRMRMPQIDGAP